MSLSNVLHISLLLSGLHLISATDGDESFKTPSSNSDIRINEIQNQLLKVQSQILALSMAAALGGDFADFKARLLVLEADFSNLKTAFDESRRGNAAANDKHDAAIATLTSYYNSMELQIKALEASMEKRTKDEADKRLPADIVEKIQSHQFADAEKLLAKMAANEKIHKIVHDVYGNSPANIDVILDFAKALKGIDLKRYVLSALRYEMRSNGHRDPYKMIALVQELESVERLQIGPCIEVNATITETIADIIDVATETLKAAMYSDTYQMNVRVEALVNAIHTFRFSVSNAVMERVVNESYPAVSAAKIADNVFSSKCIAQSAIGLVALFWKLDSVNDLNNKVILNIADYLKQLRAMRDYRTVAWVVQVLVNRVINNMPTCAKNLFFAEKVYIYNIGQSEYLYAASDQYKYDRDRRSVFTWGTKQRVNQGVWYVEKIGDRFHFKNTKHTNEYLYAVGYKQYQGDKRYVMTWVPGGEQGDQSAWDVELDGNVCYLRNQQYNEYLYASGDFHSRWRRYVFTWIPGTLIRQPNFQWKITS